MVKCPYCEKEWIPDQELVCKVCDPKFKADMILSDLVSSIQALANAEQIAPSRYKLITEAIDNLKSIRNRLYED